MMKQTLLAAVFVGLLAAPASAQTIAAASSATASSSSLFANPAPIRQPALGERLALASAAFEAPRPLARPKDFDSAATRDAAVVETQIPAKEEWSADDGLRVRGAKIAYKSRF
jgi:hypothetical protein